VLVEGSGTSNSDDASHPPSIDNYASPRVVPLYNEHSVTTPLSPSQTLQPRPVLLAEHSLGGTLLPTIMGPITIVSILGGVLSCVHAIVDVIDKAQRADAAAHEARWVLKRTVLDVEDDIKFYKTMISVLESTENENTLLFLQRFAISCCPLTVPILEGVPLTFYYRDDANHAMEKFREDLSSMTTLLGAESAKEPSTRPSSLKSFLQSLMYLRPAKQRTVVSELKDARNKILDNQQNSKRDFKLLWNLYTISQQQADTGAIFSLDGSSVKTMTALNAVSWEFISHPFGISQLTNSFSLSVLNRDHDAASQKEELARKLGKGWIDARVNRHHVPANQLIDVQIPLFEFIWSGTIQQLEEKPTHSTNDPEHREFEQILNQLDSSLQEAITRSKRPRFTLSFYGMVKAGKSLFLNSLIGKIVLPSNGRYPCK
jgi:hypothetical protein